jgi:hypothetical protein
MSMGYNEACALAHVLREALKRTDDWALVPPSFVEPLRQIEQFMSRVTKVQRNVVEIYPDGTWPVDLEGNTNGK